jgi:hypothetical protein
MKGKYTKNPLKEYNNRKAESEERTKPEEVEEHMATAKAQSFFFSTLLSVRGKKRPKESQRKGQQKPVVLFFLLSFFF